ncbi:hypothetical protein [Sphingomonas sp. HMP6]|uniref:hypothetical protein n=1 Tax=Sphingomonas sp. HMP6 TaxID=1517551 RepID=UPI001596F073|nr:hypothetical protein [Sphingomonas sp. HMP6]BCA57591.1 hypothetical protein HMP06_0360 [Sphingomonas sp. HMP6]
MIYIWLNLFPILIATTIGLTTGAAYRVTFDRSVGRMSIGAIVTAALGLFWFASILAGALILAPPKAAPWIMAVGSAVVIWAGFVLPVVAITHSYRSAPPRRAVGDSLYWLITMVAQAVAMKLIGLVPPPV